MGKKRVIKTVSISQAYIDEGILERIEEIGERNFSRYICDLVIADIKGEKKENPKEFSADPQHIEKRIEEVIEKKIEEVLRKKGIEQAVTYDKDFRDIVTTLNSLKEIAPKPLDLKSPIDEKKEIVNTGTKGTYKEIDEDTKERISVSWLDSF